MGIFKGFSSIRSKMMTVFLSIVLLATISITAVSFMETKKEVTYQIEVRVENRLAELVEETEHEFTAHKRLAESLGSIYAAKGNTLSKDDYRLMMEKMLPVNQNTLGIGLWLEPYTYEEASKYFGPYVYKYNGHMVYTEEYEGIVYDYPNQDWYKRAKSSEGKAVFTDPYYDESTGITMITAAVPIEANGEFMGVVSADYDLTTIQKLVNDVEFEESGYAFLVDSKGVFIAHRDEDKIMNKLITNDEEFKPLGQKMLKEDDGSIELVVGGEEYMAYYTNLPSTGWKMVETAPVSELYMALDALVFKSVLVTGAIILISAGLIYMFSLQISRGIQSFVEKLEFLAKGDFTQEVEVCSNDEVGRMGQYYNQALENLRSAMKAIYENTEVVASTAEELSVGTEETTKSVAEVAESIQMVATNSYDQRSHVDEMNRSTRDIYEKMNDISLNIKNVKDSSLGASKLSHEGNIHVNEVISQMEEINTQVSKSSRLINELNEKSRKIEEIISMITDIAEQTNLLALNAAIEAARAGEHGKGFAVVADEVRKLADASSRSSADINLLIREIQQGISESVEVMNASTESTQSGIKVVQKTGESFRSISSSVEDVTSLTEEAYNEIVRISSEMDQMKAKVEYISELAVSNDASTQNVSAATEEQTAIIEQIKASTEKLADMSSELKSEIGKFNI